jgi:serine/threonine-protein kinase
MAVGAALPGGDPLAAALAAGETPSLEMVAAAGSSGALRLGVAIACLALLLIGLCVVAFVAERGSALGAVGREFKKPDILEETARTIAADLGYEQPKLGHSACGIYYKKAYLDHLQERDAPARWDCASIYFWYRQSPRVISPVLEWSRRVELRDPRLWHFLGCSGPATFPILASD